LSTIVPIHPSLAGIRSGVQAAKRGGTLRC
jgi:hypothetical protein